jgi:type IV secretion system protein TrbL
LGGAALLLLSAFAPWAVFRLLPFVEAGAAGHLEALGHRAGRTAAVPMRSLAQTAMRLTASGGLSSAGAGMVGGAMGGSLAGGVMGRMSGGSPGVSGNGSRSGAGPGAGLGSPAGGPDLGPSSATITGVGTMDPPGHGIPMWGIHPEATAAANGYGPGPEGGAEAWATSSAGPVPPDVGTRSAGATSSGASELQPLPRQTGALRADALGRDELGIKLVAAPTTDSPWRPAPEEPGG